MQQDDLPKQANQSPLSLSRLREAFATMLGEQNQGAVQREQAVEPSPEPSACTAQCCEINPRSVVEAILFVGRPDNRGFSSRELAVAMRGVSPSEIDAAVRELNSLYEADDAPYRIEGTNNGYRLVLREEFARMRDKFYGRVREARLSTAALEVLSIVAYNEPVTAEEINQLRSAPNSAALSTLVRRRLVRLDRPTEPGAPARYSTTERFLKLFDLESLDALPRSEELEKV